MTLFPMLISAAFATEAEPATDLGLAVAQDEAGDIEDDPAAPKEESVRAERDAVKSGRVEDEAKAGPKRRSDRIVKTIQPKTFIKNGRFEFGPSVGFVTNDPFLNRYIIGIVSDYHLTEVLAVEAQLSYAPILGSGGVEDPDWKPLSKQLLEENKVSPDISKLTTAGSLGIAYAPIYGKAAVGRGIIAFDIYGHFGLGFVQTSDDLVALQAQDDPAAIATQNQTHPTTVFGGGARIAFNETLAVRVEGKSMSYIETISSTTLEMKNNVILQANASFFLGGKK
jgi:outer membrane beta-barrel protein